jgi:hypothetical protein
MERLDSVLSAAVAARRAQLIADDTNTDPAIRIDRAEIGPGCRIKVDDDVLVNGEIKRVVAPADYPGWFTSLTLDQNGFVWGTDDSTQVTDRAPADPNEEALPIFAEPAP